jgi:hypothetical protein
MTWLKHVPRISQRVCVRHAIEEEECHSVVSQGVRPRLKEYVAVLLALRKPSRLADVKVRTCCESATCGGTLCGLTETLMLCATAAVVTNNRQAMLLNLCEAQRSGTGRRTRCQEIITQIPRHIIRNIKKETKSALRHSCLAILPSRLTTFLWVAQQYTLSSTARWTDQVKK